MTFNDHETELERTMTRTFEDTEVIIQATDPHGFWTLIQPSIKEAGGQWTSHDKLFSFVQAHLKNKPKDIKPAVKPKGKTPLETVL